MDRSYKVEILPPAQEELEEIARLHMALSGPKSAREITDKLYARMETLARFPLSGSLIRDDQLKAAGYRFVPADKYLIIYRFLGDAVVIYHIAHGATDYPRLFR